MTVVVLLRSVAVVDVLAVTVAEGSLSLKTSALNG